MSLQLAPSCDLATVPSVDTAINQLAPPSMSVQFDVGTAFPVVQFAPSVVLKPLPLPNNTVTFDAPTLLSAPIS